MKSNANYLELRLCKVVSGERKCVIDEEFTDAALRKTASGCIR